MNINEIAKLAEVSRATVSRYLNNGYVSEEKKLRIKKVIDETGYKPSAQARQLRSKKTKMIGVVLPKINSESISRVVAGISIVLNKAGYQLLLGNTDNDEKQEIQYIKLFKAHQVDGILLIGTILTKEHYKIMKEINLPIVIIGQHSTNYSCIYHDDYNAAVQLTQCLLKNSKNPAFIGVTEKDIAAGKNRYDGFINTVNEFMTKNNIKLNMEEFKKTNIRFGAFSYDTGYAMTKELLTANPDIDCIFCATDSIAIGSLMYLRENNINVPEQIQLTGIGDTMMGKVAAVSLTTAHYYYKTSGIEAANMLLGMIDSKENIRKEVKMGYKIIENSSTKNKNC